MKRAFISTVCVLTLVAATAGAVDLPDPPIQSAMDRELAASRVVQFADDWETGSSNPTSVTTQPEPIGESKSLAKAILWSALVPGGGEFYVGNRQKARYFFAAEALTWIGYVSFHLYSNWKEEDFINFAAINAGAQLADKSEEFQDLVGFYQDVNEYNRAGRVTDQDRPYYFEDSEYAWRWEDKADRRTYRDLKNSSREADRRAGFMIGMAVVNRIVSMIDAARDTRQHNNRFRSSFSRDSGTNVEFSVNPFGSRNQVKLTLFSNL